MLISKYDFELYWKYGSFNYPVIILGAGRWGRVLASVIANARGHTDNMVMVSRSNYMSTKTWISSNYRLSKLIITENSFEAISCFKNHNQPPLFIVASRPSQHCTDVLDLIQYNIPIMVEKPIADKGDKALKLLQQYSESTSYNLSVGIEFSLTPVFHYISSLIKNSIKSLSLYWHDPSEEIRYGEVKRFHNEIHILDDIIYHALSIFKIFVKDFSNFSMIAASVDDNKLNGSIELINGNILCQVKANQLASKRLRLLIIGMMNGDEIRINFSDKTPFIYFYGKTLKLPDHYKKFNSNLRLEIGCLFYALKLPQNKSPLSTDLKVFTTLHKQLNEVIG